MNKNKKYISEREKISNAQKREFTAAKSDASPTMGEGISASLGKTAEDRNNKNGDEGYVPSPPSELMPTRINWQNIFTLIASIVTLIGFIGGVIFWFAKLDSKVDSTASDVVAIKPKVDQLLINSEKQDVRINILEKNQPAREKEKNQN